MLDVVAPEFIAWIEGAWEGAGQYVDLSQGGFWPDLPGAEYFPQMYRYTLPEHPLFGVQGGENALSFLTAHYSPRPMVIRGYGAGAEVTAAGVLSDVLRLALVLR